MGEATEVATQYLQALGGGDVETAVNLVADNADFRSPMGRMEARSRSAPSSAG
jgi:hypothetical protein